MGEGRCGLRKTESVPPSLGSLFEARGRTQRAHAKANTINLPPSSARADDARKPATAQASPLSPTSPTQPNVSIRFKQHVTYLWYDNQINNITLILANILLLLKKLEFVTSSRFTHSLPLFFTKLSPKAIEELTNSSQTESWVKLDWCNCKINMKYCKQNAWNYAKIKKCRSLPILITKLQNGHFQGRLERLTKRWKYRLSVNISGPYKLL